MNENNGSRRLVLREPDLDNHVLQSWSVFQAADGGRGPHVPVGHRLACHCGCGNRDVTIAGWPLLTVATEREAAHAAGLIRQALNGSR